MNPITKVFEGHQLRIIERNNEPWFVAKDVCNILGILNPTDTLKRLEENERARFNLGRQGAANIVNESGLYELIFASRKAEAKEFKNWIKRDVLPSIRKHSAYITPEKIEEVLLNPDTLIQLATRLKEEQQKRRRAEQLIEHQKPKVLFAEAVETSSSSVLIGELSKILRQNGVDIGQNRLFEWLRKNGYLIRQHGESYNLPTQRSMDQGLFEIKKRTINNPNGSIRTTRTPKVTGKGQIYFVQKFLEESEVVS
ncbi:phage antirepressor [Paucisalibacillus globulus]|uniref:phage antirepressor n=1 Tax=Paucisalibacillus globulus TaxID=351095 RepID=UPI00041E8447|nr:phage antirepressor [Paucisalibacillus globulus]